MQKHANLVDLVKSFQTNILLQNLASIQERTSPVKFAHLAEKSEQGSIPNLSTKVTGGGRACEPACRQHAAKQNGGLPYQRGSRVDSLAEQLAAPVDRADCCCSSLCLVLSSGGKFWIKMASRK